MITYKEVTEVNLTPLGLGPWSFSKQKMLTKCPFQFYLKYILKAKPTVVPPTSIVTETGKAAHRILELVVMGKSIDDAFRLVKREYEAVLPGDLWDKGDGHEAGGVGRSEYSITKFKERLDEFEKKHPVKRYLTELRIGVTKDWEPTGFFEGRDEDRDRSRDPFYRGVIDLVIQLENKDVIFMDFKFGPPAIIGVKNFRDQLNTYKVLFSKGVEPYSNAQSGIFFIRDGEVTMDGMSTKEEVESSLHNRLIFSIKGAVDKLIELGYFKHIMGPQCVWCEFSGPCKAGELKKMELETKRWFAIKQL